jgi:hypothetical protein
VVKKFVLLASILGCLMNLAACSQDSPYVTWKEEVKLNDGRVIVVEQKKRPDGGIAREAWLTINLPEFSTQPIVWHENLSPLIVNIDGGKLYVVGYPPTIIEENKYGKPSPDYVAFVWDHGAWNRIPFDDIPQQIYTTNMLIDGFPPKGITILTLKKKNGPEMNGDATQPPGLLRLSPRFG